MTPTLLAIESSTDWLSVALLRGEEVVALEECEHSRQHAPALLPAIDAVLIGEGVRLDDLDAIGVSTGPGSFTGLRIGLATVKGLAFERSLLGVGVSTLEAMALAVLEDESRQGNDVHQVVTLLDARRGEWYAGGWSRPISADGLPVAGLPEGLYSPRELLADLGGEALLVSPEAAGWQRAFEAAAGRSIETLEGRVARPRADWVGRLAARRFALGEAVPVSTLAARYLRRAEAEAKRLGGPVAEGEVARIDGVPG